MRAISYKITDDIIRYKKSIIIFFSLNIVDFITTLFLKEANPLSVGNLNPIVFAMSKFILCSLLVLYILKMKDGHWIKWCNIFMTVVVVFNLVGLGIGVYYYFMARYGLM